MSVSIELLLEQITKQEDAIRAATESGHDTRSMWEELVRMRTKLASANQALNEGKQLLKS